MIDTSNIIHDNIIAKINISDLKTGDYFDDEIGKKYILNAVERYDVKGVIILIKGEKVKSSKNIGISRYGGNCSTLRETIEALEFINIPTLAAISGRCEGPYFEVAISTSIRVCDKSAIFNYDKTKTKIFENDTMESRIKKLLKRSYHDKTEIMFESDTNSEVAKECGFVSAIYENGNMETQSITYFREMIKKRNKYALECTMKTLRAFKKYPEIFAHEVEWQQFSNLLCKSE